MLRGTGVGQKVTQIMSIFNLYLYYKLAEIQAEGTSWVREVHGYWWFSRFSKPSVWHCCSTLGSGPAAILAKD
jgi:hypothetical protein